MALTVSQSVSQSKMGDIHLILVAEASNEGRPKLRCVCVGNFSKVVLSCPHQPTRPRRSLDLHYSQAVSPPPPREHEASEIHRSSVSIHTIDTHFWHVFCHSVFNFLLIYFFWNFYILLFELHENFNNYILYQARARSN